MSSRRRRFRSRPKPQPKKPPTNEEINVIQLRVVGTSGDQRGVMSKKEALDIARQENVDLVVVAEKANPPVARLMDIGKYMYEKRKKQAKQKKSSKQGDIKGVRIGFKTDEHDWNLRIKQASRFIEEGHKVKLEIRLRGRERTRIEQAETKLRQFISDIPGNIKIEGKVSKAPRALSALLTQ